MSKVLEYTRKGLWLLGVQYNINKIYFYFIQGLGITSCLARNDFNVAFSIISLILLTNFYNQNPKITTKIIIQMLTVLFVAEIIWIYLYSSAWKHNEESFENLKSSKFDKDYWDSIWFIHKFVYILAYIELILKCFLLYYLIADYKEKYKFKDLFNFNYDDTKSSIKSSIVGEEQINYDNSMNRFVNESSYSYEDNFQNKY